MEKKYPIGGYAPGNYWNKCGTCNIQFTGDKRAYQCEPCGTKSQAEYDALTEEEKEERTKRNIEAYNQFIKEVRDPIINKSQQAPTGAVSDDAHEKEAMMKGFDRVRKAFETREWIMEGRGGYPYNDDRYKEEVRYLFDEVERIIKETWVDVKSKSFEYRQQIIAQYLKENQPTGAVWHTSHYDRLYDQVKSGKQSVCYVDYNAWGTDRVYRDICTIGAETMTFVSRGHGYGCAKYMSGNERELFIELCESIHVEWLEESTAINPDELWDEFSEYVDDDIDSLTRYAGSSVMTKEGWRKVAERMKR